MPFGGLLTVGLLTAGGSIAGSLIGKSAASKAADTQAESARESLDFQKQVYGDQKQNQQPFVDAGQYSIGRLMDLLKSGTYGPGSIPDFKAPTLEDARNTPGYQFTQQQGEQGIERGAAAAGGAFTGGTLKALAGFDTGLADSTYSNVFNRALSTYQTLLNSQAQGFGQLASVASAGQGGIQSINNSGTAAAGNVGNLLTQSGNAQAAGIVGGANAITSGITGATSALSTPFYLQYLNNQQPQNSQLPNGQTYNVPYQPPAPQYSTDDPGTFAGAG